MVYLHCKGQRKKVANKICVNDGEICERDDSVKQEQVEQSEQNKVRKRQVDMETSRADSGKVIHDVPQSENKKNKLFEPIYCQSFHQQESKESSDCMELSISGYCSLGRTQQWFRKDIRPPHSAPFPPSSISYTSASDLCLLTKPIPSDVIPNMAPHFGYSSPTSTVTSQAYEREQKQERKPKIENLPPKVSNIKKVSSLLDNVVFDGSMMASIDGLYVNPQANISRPNPAFPTFTQYKNILNCNEEARIPSRPSVIRNTNTERGQEWKCSQMETQLPKMHGNIIKQTGKSSILNLIVDGLIITFFRKSDKLSWKYSWTEYNAANAACFS